MSDHSQVEGWKQRVGQSGEVAALDYLEKSEMQVLATDWRCSIGQIDLVADDHGTVVLIEVKARRSDRFGLPQEAVDQRKQQKLRNLLEVYCLVTKQSQKPCRIDVLGILLDQNLQVRKLDHIKNAVEG